MNKSYMITPHDFYVRLSSIHDYRRGSIEEEELRDFIQNASLKEFEELMLLCIHLSTIHNVKWLEQAKTSLNIRIAEQAAESAKKLITYTEQLAKQTEQVKAHSELLTKQNEILPKESKGLGRLTWGLFILTIILSILTAALLFIDCEKDKKIERPISSGRIIHT